jgi:hypothetical protein
MYSLIAPAFIQASRMTLFCKFINCPGFQAGVKAGINTWALARMLVAAKAGYTIALYPWLKPGAINAFKLKTLT